MSSTSARPPTPPQPSGPVVIAGATGDLGLKVVEALRQRGATVHALVRPGRSGPQVERLQERGAVVREVDFESVAALIRACEGATCVVSTLSGLRDVIVDTQTRLMDAAVEAGVPRFIPSDYSIDYTRLPEGSNRNLDLRRAFAQRLDVAPIRATSVLCGMFTGLLAGQAPVVLPRFRRVVYWGSADQPLDFTTVRDTAAFTAAAALDLGTPRYLRIAGEVATIREVQAAAGAATGERYRLLKAGSLGALGAMIRVTRVMAPSPGEVFPPWQGMQYLHNMLSGRAKLESLDNARYPDFRWTPVRDVLASRDQHQSGA